MHLLFKVLMVVTI